MARETTRGHLMSVSPCTACGRQLDSAMVICDSENIQPNPGDITVCLLCGHIMSFCEDLTLRDLTVAEISKIAGDKRILAIQRMRGKTGLGKKLR
jgi:hypothetical protein